MQGQGRFQRQIKGFTIHHRQRARQAQTNRTGLSVGFIRTKSRRTATEQFRVCAKLNVNFKPDNDGIISAGHSEKSKSWDEENFNVAGSVITVDDRE